MKDNKWQIRRAKIIIIKKNLILIAGFDQHCSYIYFSASTLKFRYLKTALESPFYIISLMRTRSSAEHKQERKQWKSDIILFHL